jgi:hypothetical protein
MDRPKGASTLGHDISSSPSLPKPQSVEELLGEKDVLKAMNVSVG